MDRMVARVRKGSKDTQLFYILEKGGGSSITQRQWLIFSTYALQPSRIIVRYGLDVTTFVTRRLHACHHARAPSGGRWNCERETSGKFA
jgi:hypothetical protein